MVIDYRPDGHQCHRGRRRGTATPPASSSSAAAATRPDSRGQCRQSLRRAPTRPITATLDTTNPSVSSNPGPASARGVTAHPNHWLLVVPQPRSVGPIYSSSAVNCHFTETPESSTTAGEIIEQTLYHHSHQRCDPRTFSSQRRWSTHTSCFGPLQVSGTLRSDLAIDSLEMAIWSRKHEDLSGLIHHSDRGVQYLSIRYTERLEQENAVASVGSKGDSYDNALAETINGLYKSELLDNEHEGPWRTVKTSRTGHARLGALVEPRAPTQAHQLPAAARVQKPTGARDRIGVPRSPESAELETGGTNHPGNETLGEHQLADVSS